MSTGQILPTPFSVVMAERLYMIKYMDAYIIKMSQAGSQNPSSDYLVSYTHCGTTSHIWRDLYWVNVDISADDCYNHLMADHAVPQDVDKRNLMYLLACFRVRHTVHANDQHIYLAICKSLVDNGDDSEDI